MSCTVICQLFPACFMTLQCNKQCNKKVKDQNILFQKDASCDCTFMVIADTLTV